MIRRYGEWLPFWRHRDGWCVSVLYVRDGRRCISPTRPSRWRLVALWRGLRADVLEPPRVLSFPAVGP